MQTNCHVCSIVSQQSVSFTRFCLDLLFKKWVWNPFCSSPFHSAEIFPVQLDFIHSTLFLWLVACLSTWHPEAFCSALVLLFGNLTWIDRDSFKFEFNVFVFPPSTSDKVPTCYCHCLWVHRLVVFCRISSHVSCSDLALGFVSVPLLFISHIFTAFTFYILQTLNDLNPNDLVTMTQCLCRHRLIYIHWLALISTLLHIVEKETVLGIWCCMSGPDQQ